MRVDVDAANLAASGAQALNVTIIDSVGEVGAVDGEGLDADQGVVNARRVRGVAAQVEFESKL